VQSLAHKPLPARDDCLAARSIQTYEIKTMVRTVDFNQHPEARCSYATVAFTVTGVIVRVVVTEPLLWIQPSARIRVHAIPSVGPVLFCCMSGEIYA